MKELVCQDLGVTLKQAWALFQSRCSLPILLYSDSADGKGFPTKDREGGAVQRADS